MRNETPDSGDSTRIDVAAAEWLIKRDRGFTAAEQDEFLQWIAADPRHGEWFARHQQTWSDFNQLAQCRPEHGTEPNPDLLAGPQPRRSWFIPAGLGIAATITLVFTVWSLRPAAPSSADAQPAVSIVAENYQRRTLPDGSIVELNRGGAIETQFSPDVRRVRLVRGEAHFTVLKEAQRPFVVRAGGVDVRAIGTAFNVRLETASVEVLVTEGRVGLERAPNASPGSKPRASSPIARTENPGARHTSTTFAQLEANERARVSLADTSVMAPVIEKISPHAVRAALAWQPQLLDFNSTPLREVVDEFNRRNVGGVRLVLADSTLNTIPIVASIRSDNVEGFVRLLQGAAGIRADDRGNGEIVLRKGP